VSKDLDRHLNKKDVHLAHMHMKIYATLYVIGELKLKQWDTTSIRMAKILNTIALNTGEELSFIAGQNAKWYNHSGKLFDSILQS